MSAYQTLLKDQMTLRDHFAGEALNGLLSDPTLHFSVEELAIRAYRLADAMLKQREKDLGK